MIYIDMEWASFHHPDISWPVVRRRAGIELMELLELTTLFCCRGGWGIMNRHCYPNKAAYQNAVSRLRKNGLLINRTGPAETPELSLSDDGRGLLPDYFNPEACWTRRWNKIWYLLSYDIPEVDRAYRNVMRSFLKRMKMGCLQKSVWVTPRDIRPEYDDLSKGASLDGFAYLFEARTVLGLPNRRVVDDAWDFDLLYERQSRYCDSVAQNLERLQEDSAEPEELGILMRQAVNAYHSVFLDDPLLPAELLPRDYRGREAYALHKQLFASIGKQLEGSVI